MKQISLSRFFQMKKKSAISYEKDNHNHTDYCVIKFFFQTIRFRENDENMEGNFFMGLNKNVSTFVTI